MRKVFQLALTLVPFLLLEATTVLGQEISLYEVLGENLEHPIGVEFSHEESSVVYIVSRSGFIERFDKNDPEGTFERWFDLPEEVFLLSEGGLLGLTFHPDYPENNSFFVYYTYDDNDQYRSRISRFKVKDEVADETSEEILLEFDQPGSNHNGGALEFGPDGYLYISSGDGGGTRQSSQDLANLLGAILRIDINTEEGYLIPPDNPLIDKADAMDEIFAWGFRNPWRMSFDLLTGHLWVADVGQSDWESIYIVEKGKNYGWPIIEGSHCFPTTCDKSGLEMPIYEYPWGEDNTGMSITGGYVYRGNVNPSLFGKYIYGDYVSGRIWALEVDHDTREVLSNKELYHAEFNIPSFGVDSDREIYTIGWGTEQKLYRFEPEAVSLPGPVQLLSPDNNAEDVSLNPSFVWSGSEGADLYHLQLSTESEFTDLLIDEESLSDTIFTASNDLEHNTQYYWRVQASNEGGNSDWSEVFVFNTEVAVSITNSRIPDQFSLEQNYPNPFNPVTQIRFGLTESSEVRLTVYNMLGQRVALLVNEQKPAGWHTVTFDAAELSSGIYIYRIHAGDNVAIRKLTLLK